MYYVVGALRRCGVRGGGVRKTFTLACVWLWVVGVSQCLRRLSCVIYRSAGIYMASVLARRELSPFFSPPDAKTRLRRVHYGPKIAVPIAESWRIIAL